MIYKNKNIFVKHEASSIPWLVVFTNNSYKEFSQCPKDVKSDILEVLDIVEKELLSFYKPEKINIASFGNILPRVHFHIMARFTDDSHFPNPMWGEKKRESTKIELEDEFLKNIKYKLNESLGT
ncbi:MAG: Diadenosine tetraphosphate (Ap4A) hydrolase and other HIT family hydrolases [uncultured Campylobacterales bacterium]|uniref:Diadenosine tetraphosphate (Ap4A) hydrolase and other HIT family hydrolases n=1 Tax=uncultured Campylobacterales bacterium TaxID=352960 RepID=A0A6S6T8P3_9BACT|nr:MAG: Diadenosine tetraphosphate (Ap4A) hydrolase and other HIT family hydrolases [uncultured Campylobacterales bacterium]